MVWNTYPDAVHGADFGAHRNDEHAIEAERTTSALVEFRCQSAHEARETEVRVQTYAYTHRCIRPIQCVGKKEAKMFSVISSAKLWRFW